MAAQIGKAFSGQVSRSPSNHAQLLCGVDFGVGPSLEVVMAGEPESECMKILLRTLRAEFVPNKVVLMRPTETETPPIVEIAEFTRSQASIDGKATAYVCRNYACKLPTTEPHMMLQNLSSTSQ